MFKLLTIALLLAPSCAQARCYECRQEILREADDAYRRAEEDIRRGAEEMDSRNEAARRDLHDMNMESHAHHQEIEMHNQSITQEGIRDQMMLNGDNPYWR